MVDLRNLFLHLQGQLASRLQSNRKVLDHPGAKGSATEESWRQMLQDYLPWRYCVSKAFVIDAEGQRSDEIDLVIHDRQYSPFLFNQDGAVFIPAESVYAVFEIKQELKANIGYAAEKVASVRRLLRTQGEVRHILGTTRPDRPPFEILGGLLCLESGWTPAFGEPFVGALEKTNLEGRLDLILALTQGAVEVTYSPEGRAGLDLSAPDAALIFFFLRLLERLQKLGTVPAMDLRRYGKTLEG